jgi:hypothetical protein
MSWMNLITESVFDAKARLQLLQLQARRQMAERVAKKAAAAGSDPQELTIDDEEEGDDEGATDAPTAVPAVPGERPPQPPLHALLASRW